MWIVCDGSHLGYRAKYSLGGLSHNGDQTGVIFGILQSILEVGDHYCTNNIAFGWDSRKNIRKEYRSSYKEKRGKEKQELTGQEKADMISMFSQMNILRTEVLPEIGLTNNIMTEGFEVDDIMGSLVFDERYKKEKFALFASDKDLYQLLRGQRVWIHRPNKRSYTEAALMAEYNCTPEQWKTVKSMGGCGSDEVEGIEGVGVKTVVKYLNGDLKTTYVTFKKIESKEGRKIEKRNRKLVWLPHPETPQYDLQQNEFSVKGFKNVCKRFGFTSFLSKDKHRWLEFLRGYER